MDDRSAGDDGDRRRAPGDEVGIDAESRRRVVDVAMSHRPDLSFDELRVALGEVGIEVDEPTLIADLDAIGYDVHDPQDGDAGRGGADRAGRRPAVPEGAVAQVSPSRISSTVALAGAAVAVVVIIVALLVSGDGGDQPGGGGRAEATSAGAGSSTSGPSGPPRVAPSGFGPDPALTEPDVDLTFDGDAPALPPPADGVAWDAVAGSFSVVGGQAVSAEPGEERAVTTFTPPSADLRAQVILPQATLGAGLAIKSDGAGSYLAWVAAPNYSTVALHRVVDGESEGILNSGITQVKPNVTLGVNIVGSRIELLANGVVVATHDEPGEATGIGLVAMTPLRPGVFDDLQVQYP